MSETASPGINKGGRPRKPKPATDEPKRPRGRPKGWRPPKKVSEQPEADPDDLFLQSLKLVRRRKSSLELDQNTLEIIFHCARRASSQAECASILGVTPGVLRYFFDTHPEAREVWEDGLNVSRVKLRSMQFKLAEKNQIMAIFLGKNMLGQKDVQNIDATISKPANELTEEQLLEIAQGGGNVVPLRKSGAA